MYSFQNKELTISQESLSAKELRTFNFCVSQGDSKNLSLWTIEHIERSKNKDNSMCELAYYS